MWARDGDGCQCGLGRSSRRRRGETLWRRHRLLRHRRAGIINELACYAWIASVWVLTLVISCHNCSLSLTGEGVAREKAWCDDLDAQARRDAECGEKSRTRRLSATA